MMKYLVLVLFLAVVVAFDDCNDAPQLLQIGSSTVFPVAELFGRRYSNVDVLSIVTDAGSDQGSILGFRNLLTGAIDMGFADRFLTGDDLEGADCDASLLKADGTGTSSACQGVLPLCVKVGNNGDDPLVFCYDSADVSVFGDAFVKQKITRKYLCDFLGEDGQAIVEEAGFTGLTADEISTGSAMIDCDEALEFTFDTFSAGDFQDCKDIRSVVITGSSTVFPITSSSETTCGTDFVNIVTGSSGSSVGIATFLAGGNNLAAASRALRGKDYASFGCDDTAIDALGNANAPCQDKQPKSLIIGRDMLSIIVNTESDLKCVTLDDLIKIFVDASEGYTLCGADIQSGTRDFFEEEVGAITDDSFSGFANDEDIVECIKEDSNAIAFIPVAFVAQRSDVKVVNVGDGCVNPTDNPDDYPLARPLFIVYDSLSVFNDEQSIDYLCCLLSPQGQKLVSDVGYTALAEIEIENEKTTNELVCS